MMKLLGTCLKLVMISYLAFLIIVIVCQRKLLYYPSHDRTPDGLATWEINGESVGVCRPKPHPKNVWLFLHGNAGQASDRSYALHCFSTDDAVFFLEYPGYGSRGGKPGRASFNQAAVEGYTFLRRSFPGIPVCVAAESIGSGPATELAKMKSPPDKLVLIVPFDTMAGVVRDRLLLAPASLFLLDRWDNLAALKSYNRRVDIFGAADDRIIQTYHAKRLAQGIRGAFYHEITGGHNDWADGDKVKIRNQE